MAHRLSSDAEADLDDIWYYIASESGNAAIAERFIYYLTDRFQFVARNPYIGRRRDSDLRPGLRSFPIDDYVILYRIDGEDILILRVVHGGRDLHSALIRRG
jgi:toxin ParE1/3/4